MPKISVIIKGQGSADHTIKSPTLSQSDADSQLDEIGKLIGEPEVLELPWIRVEGINIISANQLADPSMPRVG